MATIQPIESRSIHQIQSGQVIVDLHSVAKELVENALDAGATAIDVRFKNYGLDSIEVQDNGAGIAPEDFDTLALKHYTSKLSTYDDLSSLSTFGFRGEALSSLCALSKMHIVTARAVDGPKGTKLEFDQSGKLNGTSVVAAKQGTTVVVDTLFYNLPVRRKELEKTIKREYTKVLGYLNAYACISVGVKFSVSNQLKGKKTVAFATQSNPNTRENIANVYGAKTLLALIPLNLKFEMDPSNRPASTQSARNWSTQEDSGSREVRIVGHISRPVVGEGRQTPDRQMFFVNSRPAILPQVAKAFNEVYKSFNITQSAFIFADIKLDPNAYDVNVSPDKKTILLHDQAELLDSLKNSLTKLFEGHDQSVPQAQTQDRRVSSFKPPILRQRESTNPAVEANSSLPEAVDMRRDTHSEESSDSTVVPEEGRLPGFVKASLIERFAGRDTETRVTHYPPRQNIRIAPEKGYTPLLEDEQEDEPALEARPDRDASPLFEPGTERPDHAQQLPIPVQDFNARIASQEARQRVRQRSSMSPEAEQTDEEDEESIPAIRQTPQRPSSQSTIQNAFDRMRPMRTPSQQATITIGNTTTVSTIGSSSRRARIHTPKFSLNGTPINRIQKQPLLSKRLRGFAAPGTQLEDSGEEDDERGDNGESDSSMPDAPAARTPSEARTALSNETIGPSTDERYTTPGTSLADEEAAEVEAAPVEDDNDSDEEYMDESEKKTREEARVAKMIAEAEEAAARPDELNLKRAQKLLRTSEKKYQTIALVRDIEASPAAIASQVQNLTTALQDSDSNTSNDESFSSTQLDASNPEERLSLTVTKSDFNMMRIIGQFNLGFILAVRPPSPTCPSPDLFIIDQHASDEKYNFERLSATTVLVSQRLVHPHPLELTAIEEEIILNNEHALSANGFIVSIDETGDLPVGQRAKLTSLPMSKESTFTPSDLEELLTLLEDSYSSHSSHPFSQQHIPRPSKVRKLLASRACRSSIMIGKTLKTGQMEKVVRHMGEMDKPWSCPHGRPTMRHLYGLGRWESWKEGDGVVNNDGFIEGVRGNGKTDWGSYLRKRRGVE